MEKPKSALNAKKIRLLQDGFFNAGCALEFGSGGSTVLGLEHGVGKLYSVETDPDWIAHVSAYPLCLEAIAKGRLNLQHFDVGDIHIHGHPKTESHIKQWPRYAVNIWQQIHADGVADAVTGVLVDGRFRVAAALYSLIQAPDATIYFDDFTDRLESYGVVLNHLDQIDQADNLVALRRKADCDMARVTEDFAAYILQVR